MSETKSTTGPPKPTDRLQALPTFMQRQILAFFGYHDYTLAGRTCQYLHALWKKAVGNKQLPLFVPVDCTTLTEAVERVKRDDRWTTIVLGQGEHHIDGNILKISSAMHIVGDPGVAKEKIVVVGGITFKRRIPGNCHLQHLTLRQAKKWGVWGWSSFTMDDVLVEQCGGYGVVAYGTGVVGGCTNLEVRHCGFSGVLAFDGASITLIGAKTTVHHNCTDGDSNWYGLQVRGSSASTVQLVDPLTKEQVALDNGGGGNWGAGNGADLNHLKTITVAAAAAEMAEAAAAAAVAAAVARGEVRVPEDCKTLMEAVAQVHRDDRWTTIVLGQGEHHIDGNILKISSAMHIVGNPGVAKEKIVVLGGIVFEHGIQGNCHLQHLTLRQAEGNGVIGWSSFTMDDVLVEQCCGHGVLVYGTGVVVRCISVEVRQCGCSGVFAYNGASITLIGAKTTVHHNCTKGGSDEYGLNVDFSWSSTIQLAYPLTKEHVARENGGGGNWGAGEGGRLKQIKTIGGEAAARSRTNNRCICV